MIDREEWIEIQVEKKKQEIWLDNHSKSMLRGMLRREFDAEEIMDCTNSV